MLPRGDSSRPIPSWPPSTRPCAGPCIVCFLTAVHWMVVGTFLLVYASSLTHPQDTFPILGWFNDLSNNFSMFTYGRIWPAAIDALVYGLGQHRRPRPRRIWIARPHQPPRPSSPAALMTAVIFWNLGVAIGLTGIFMGDSTGVELLEFPAYASWILWFAYAVFGSGPSPRSLVAARATITSRRHGCSSPSSRSPGFTAPAAPSPKLLSWLPSASRLRRHPGICIDAWYVHGIYTLWLAPLAFGTTLLSHPQGFRLSIRYSGSKAHSPSGPGSSSRPGPRCTISSADRSPPRPSRIGLILSGLIFIPVALIGMSLVSTAFTAEASTRAITAAWSSPSSSLATVCVRGRRPFGADSLRPRAATKSSASPCSASATCSSGSTASSASPSSARSTTSSRACSISAGAPRCLVRIHYYASLYGILLVIAMLGFGGVMQGNTWKIRPCKSPWSPPMTSPSPSTSPPPCASA